MSDIIYSWKFSDKKERWSLWYIIAISIVIWLIIWWFFTKQYWMSFLVILISGIFFFIENNSPEEINVNITNDWIKISESFFEFSKIKTFSFIFVWENPEILRLNIDKRGIKNIDLKINKEICDNLKWILVDYIKQDKEAELTSIEKITNYLKL